MLRIESTISLTTSELFQVAIFLFQTPTWLHLQDLIRVQVKTGTCFLSFRNRLSNGKLPRALGGGGGGHLVLPRRHDVGAQVGTGAGGRRRRRPRLLLGGGTGGAGPASRPAGHGGRRLRFGPHPAALLQQRQLAELAVHVRHLVDERHRDRDSATSANGFFDEQ